MCIDEFENVREAGRDNVTHFFVWSFVWKQTQLDLLSLLKRDAQTQSDVISDINRTEGEDFERSVQAILVGYERNSLGTQVYEYRAGVTSAWGKGDHALGDGCGVEVGHLGALRFDSRNESLNVWHGRGDEEGADFELGPNVTEWFAQNFATIAFKFGWDCVKYP